MENIDIYIPCMAKLLNDGTIVTIELLIGGIKDM